MTCNCNKNRGLNCCKCVDSICTEDLRKRLTCLINEFVSIFFRATSFTGTVKQVGCGSILLEEETTNTQVFMPICNIELIIINPFNEPVATSQPCDQLLPHKPLKCVCECEEDVCTRDVRKQLFGCVQRELTVFTSSTLATGILKKVSCGMAVFTFENSTLIYPLCQMTAILEGAIETTEIDRDSCLEIFIDKNKPTCKCLCIEDSCVQETRETLTDCIGKEVFIFTGQFSAFSGIVKEVTCGTLVLSNAQLFGVTPLAGNVLIPLCQIQFVLPENTPFFATENALNETVIPVSGTSHRLRRHLNPILTNGRLRNIIKSN